MVPVLPLSLNFLWKTERSLKKNNDANLPETLNPEAISGLLEKAWKEIPKWDDSWMIVSGLMATERIAKVINKSLPESYKVTFTLKFNDGVTKTYTKAQLLPLLCDSEPCRSLFSDAYSEHAKKEVVFEYLRSSTFEFIMEYFYTQHADHENCSFQKIIERDDTMIRENLLEILEAGDLLLNKEIITTCLPILSGMLLNPKTGECDLELDLSHLLDILEHPFIKSQLTFDFNFRVDVFIQFRIQNAFINLNNSRSRVFVDFHTSTFQIALNELIHLMEAINCFKPTKYDKIIYSWLKRLHHQKQAFLGTVEETKQIFDGIINAGFPKTLVHKLLKKFIDDLLNSSIEPSLQAALITEAQKLKDSFN